MPIKAVLLAICVALFVMFVAPHPPASKPKLYAGMSEPQARVFDRACKDCHSNDTDWPWYSKIPPVSLGVAADVHRGRGIWNISDWASYSRGKRLGFLAAIAVGARGDRMPPRAYRWMHRDSRLTADDRVLLANWSSEERTRLVAASKPVAAK